MKDDIAGGLAVLICVLVVGFVAEYWLYLVWTGVGLAVLFGLLCVVGFGIERLQEFLQKRKDAIPSQPVVLGRVKVDGGVAVVTRQPISKYSSYPCVLTLSKFSRRGQLRTAFATHLRSSDDEGKIAVGLRGWNYVYLDTGPHGGKREIHLHKADGETVWQVHPLGDASSLTLPLHT